MMVYSLASLIFNRRSDGGAPRRTLGCDGALPPHTLSHSLRGILGETPLRASFVFFFSSLRLPDVVEA